MSFLDVSFSLTETGKAVSQKIEINEKFVLVSLLSVFVFIFHGKEIPSTCSQTYLSVEHKKCVFQNPSLTFLSLLELL